MNWKGKQHEDFMTHFVLAAENLPGRMWWEGGTAGNAMQVGYLTKRIVSGIRTLTAWRPQNHYVGSRQGSCWCCCRNPASAHWRSIEALRQEFEGHREETALLLCQAKRAIASCLLRLLHPGKDSWEYFTEQGVITAWTFFWLVGVSNGDSASMTFTVPD